jgi:hypothetical protein
MILSDGEEERIHVIWVMILATGKNTTVFDIRNV